MNCTNSVQVLIFGIRTFCPSNSNELFQIHGMTMSKFKLLFNFGWAYGWYNICLNSANKQARLKDSSMCCKYPHIHDFGTCFSLHKETGFTQVMKDKNSQRKLSQNKAGRKEERKEEGLQARIDLIMFLPWLNAFPSSKTLFYKLS